MTTRRATTPYAAGYEQGTQSAVRYIHSLRSRVARGAGVSPNDLGHVLIALLKKMDAAGGWDLIECPQTEHSPAQQRMRGEFFGFCTGLMAALPGA